MLHDILIAAHALSGVSAFILGVLVLRQPRVGVAPIFRFYLGSLWSMILFLIAVVATDWSALDSTKRVLFVALVALAVYMGWRGWHALLDLGRDDAHERNHYVDDIGFTLISLFAAFVIVGALDVGSPVWLVVVVGGLGVVVGVRGLIWAKKREVYAG